MSEEQEDYTPEELIKHFETGNLSIIAYNESVEHIMGNENNTLTTDIERLVQQNNKLGGSDLGFYFGNELFAIGPTAGVGGVGPIHDDLIEEASYVFENRQEMQQDMTYMANMLSVLPGLCSNNYLTYLANLPMEFIQFSRSIKKLAAYADAHMPNWRENYAFSKEDENYESFRLHLDRVEPKLKRYLFRQLVN